MRTLACICFISIPALFGSGLAVGQEPGDGTGQPTKPAESGPVKTVAQPLAAEPSLKIISTHLGAAYITAKYQDTQTNLTDGVDSKLNGKLTGQKFFVEATLFETIWIQFDMRSFTTNQKNWKKKDEGQVLLGPAFTFLGLIVPFVGVHSEQNKVDLDQRDSSKVAHLDHRVPVAGLFTRQGIYGTKMGTDVPNKMLVYTLVSYLKYNPGQQEASHGTEFIGGLGLAYKLKAGRVDIELGMSKQEFTGIKQPTTSDPRQMQVEIALQSTFIQTGFWF